MTVIIMIYIDNNDNNNKKDKRKKSIKSDAKPGNYSISVCMS